MKLTGMASVEHQTSMCVPRSSSSCLTKSPNDADSLDNIGVGD